MIYIYEYYSTPTCDMSSSLLNFAITTRHTLDLILDYLIIYFVLQKINHISCYSLSEN